MQFATLQDHLDCDKPTGIERAAELGLGGLELVVPDGIHDIGANGMALAPEGTDVESDDIWSAAERKRLRQVADDNGIALTSLCPSYLNFRPGLTAADAEERAAVADELRRLVDAAAALDAGVILVPFFRDASIESDEQRRRVAAEIEPAVDHAEREGVTLALETSLPAAENRTLLEAIDSPRARLYYDVGNATSFGFDPAAELRELADLLAPRIHLKDGVGGGSDCMLGEGSVDFVGVADALDAIGYDGWLVLETMFRDDPMEGMAENLRYARQLFG